MITIYFPKYLRELTDGVESHKFDTEDLQLVINGLRTLFPKLSLYLANIGSGNISNLCYFIDKEKEEVIKQHVSLKTTASELILIITIYGQGEDVGSVLIGVALIAAGFVLGPQTAVFGLSFITGGSLITAGLSIALSGFLSMLRPGSNAPSAPNDAPIRAQNDSFGSLQNTTSTDTPIALIFGQVRVPGQFIGGKIKTVNHDAGTVISVANYVN